MSLHGQIKVNHNEIADWEAENIGPVEGTKPEANFNVYRCYVEYRDNRGYLRKTGPFLVHHLYRDGALVLASMVIAQAQRLFNIQERQRG